jgi:transcriptional regulator with GAF, ATPase, and Fis domain
VRFLSATNANLEDPSRGFRSDLLDRLRSGGTIWLPSLRERLRDIPLLAEKFVREAEAHLKGAMRREITAEAIQALLAQDWPGNIRELQSVIFDAVSRQPDVEYLVAGHLRVLRGNAAHATPNNSEGQAFRAASVANGARGEARLADAETRHTAAAGLDALLSAMEWFEFDPGRAGEWAGRLRELQTACARLLARHLAACLDVTRRRTPESPGGVLQIHPAVKLITGDTKLTATRAADVIKRLLAPLKDELTGDLLEAYKIAVRLRPKSPNPPPRE